MKTTERGRVTELLQAWSCGDAAAGDALMPLVYAELSSLAGKLLRRERRGHTLEPSALVHEAYVKLAGQDRMEWRNRQQFFAIASRVMRRVLIDYARARRRGKRGGGWVRVDLLDRDLQVAQKGTEIEALESALEGLSRVDARKAAIIEMRFFGGLTARESAAVLGCSPATVRSDWRLAKAWLVRELS